VVALALGCAFAIQALVSGRPFTGKPAVVQNALAEVAQADEPVVEPLLQPVGRIPALREARRPRSRHARAHRPQRRARKVVKAVPSVQRSPLVPAATVQPRPAATPRPIAPAPQPRAPVVVLTPAAPKPTPAPPTAPPDSGEFDTTGESP
jgi:hypothetical protein